MKVKMKQYENLCNEQRARYKKMGWEYFILAGDQWLKGFHEAVRIAEELTGQPILNYLNEQEIEVEFIDGEHQIK